MFLDRWLCGLTQHRPARTRWADGRIYLACECGWESQGWQVIETPKRPVTVLTVWQPRREQAERKRA